MSVAQGSANTALTLGVQLNSSNRGNLLSKRQMYANKIAVIDNALKLLDENPAIEQLADLLKEALQSDRDF